MNARSDWALYRRLLTYLWPFRGWFTLSLCGFVLYALGNVLLADLAQFLLDALGGERDNLRSGLIARASLALAGPDTDVGEIARLVVPAAMVALAALLALGFFFGSYFMSHVARGVVHRLRCQLFDQYLAVPVAHFARFSQGELVSKLTFNVEQVSGAITEALKVAVREGFTVLGLLAYMLYLDWRLTLLFLIVAPLIGAVVAVAGRLLRRYSRRIQHSMGDVTQIASQGLSGHREVRLYNAQAQQSAQFAGSSHYHRQQGLKLALVNAVGTPLIQSLLAAGLALLVWVILDPQRADSFSPGMLVAFLGAAAQLGKPIRQLSNIQTLLQRGLAACEDVFAQLDTPVEDDDGQLQPAQRLRGALSFHDVTFRYPGAVEPALRDVSLTINPGQCVAVVGPSGSGKSTLVNLLARLYAPEHGVILLDDRPLGDYRLSALRASLAVVSQRVLLFSDTIFNNIAFASLQTPSVAAVQEAARLAGAAGFIEALPEGYNTRLGEGGAGLSGGEAQRVALARALLRDAPVLILDEATSALDADTEAQLQSALDRVLQGRAALIIAHRMRTVERADRIIVMESGRIVDQGAHGELMERCALYRRLCQQELSG